MIFIRGWQKANQAKDLDFTALTGTSPGDGIHYRFYLIVDTEYLRQGAGPALYDHLEGLALSAGAETITTNILDYDPASRRFAEKHGFIQKSHDIQWYLT